jgi:hypothetical protein
MKKKILIALGLVGIVAGSIAIGAYAATDIKLLINGNYVAADIQIIDGSSYVPLRIVSESLGADVKWDGVVRTISITSGTPVATPIPDPVQQTVPAARIDFHSAEHIAASKARLAKDYPDSYSTQKMLQESDISSQKELENLINGLDNAEWTSLKGSYNRLVSDYFDSPSTVLMLFKSEIESYRKMK